MIKIQPVKNNQGELIVGPLIIEPHIIHDERGFFFESWNQSDFDKAIGEKVIFKQDNHSSSIMGSLRGLHYQISSASQGKLVRATRGSIFDVFVDLRVNSPTFSKWSSIELNQTNHKQIWIPSGFAHGFLTLSKVAEVQYKATSFWNKEFERSINWNDSEIGIEWPLEKIPKNAPILSIKDSQAPSLDNALTLGDLFE